MTTNDPKTLAVPFDTREQMFDTYMDNDCNLSEVSRQFGISMTSVGNISRRENWNERASRIKARIQKSVDDAIMQRETTHIKIARTILKRELESYIARMNAGRAVGTVPNMISIMEYIDKRAGVGPGESSSGIGALNLNIKIEGNGGASPTSQREENLRRNLQAIFARGNSDADAN